MIKFNKEKHLILDCSEEIILADEIKYIRSSESKEERQRFAWLTVGNIPAKTN